LRTNWCFEIVVADLSLEPFGIGNINTAELQDPVVNGVLDHALVTRWIYNLGTSFMLFEDRNDLITQERSRPT
jgi:hypothetical protein